MQVLARRSLRERQPIGEMVYPGFRDKAGLRVVAVPVNRMREVREALVAGFRDEAATLAALERMELRARLAGAVLNALHERDAHARESAEQSALLETNGNGAVVLDSEGAILGANRAARMLLPMEIADQTKTAISGKSVFSNFFAETEQKTVENWLLSNARRGVEQNIEITGLKLASGARVKLQSRALGERRQAVVLIPERSSSAEQEVESAELQNLAEWLDQGVVIYDREEKIRLMNLRFAQLAGLAPEEMATITNLNQLVDRVQEQAAEPASFSYKWKELAVRQEGGEREEVHLVRPAARVLERASRPVLDQQGQRIGRIELYKDLTAQRVFHAKLLQTEKMAALGQMVSGVAHELSNPLTSILGYAQRLLVRGDGSQNFEDLRKIFAEAERAGAILRRMLSVSRDTGPERRPVNLNQLVQRTIDLQRFSLAAERIRVELSLDALLPDVTGDAGQLQQVLINLFGNARQAIESQGNGGTIRIRTESTPQGGVRLEVSDSGPGIPESILSRIFDPFFTTKPAGVGTGLGLSLVLSLVRDHGGQVQVTSPRGGGAVFTVELPAAGENEIREAVVRQRPTANNQENGDVAQRFRRETPAGRVLIVEDEPTVSQLIADVMRDEGFEAETLLDGREAKERILRGNYDLIICDMKMPNLDGQTLYDGLSSTLEVFRGKFLFVTGDVLGTKTRGFLEGNRVPYLAKPFRVEELLEKIHQVLQPAHSTAVQRVSPIRKNSATTG